MRTALVTGALVALSTGLALAPLAHADDVTAAPAAEAWFQANPSCASPVGCLSPAAVPGAPAGVPLYPSGTLHVAVSGGQETARTYLAFPAGTFADAQQAKLSIPIDVDPASGTVSPETAKAQVCLTTAPVVPVEGSLVQPPAAECSASATVSYVATPTPRLEADLGPLLTDLPAASGLVLLPDATSTAPGDAWHVAFSSVRRMPVTSAPASVTVQRADGPAAAPQAEQPAAPAADPVAELPSLDAPSAPAFDAVAAELGEAPLPAVDLPAVDGAAPEAAPEEVVEVEQVAFPETITVGYAYPGVWLLPLGLLVVVPLVGRALTRDLTPKPEDDVRE